MGVEMNITFFRAPWRRQHQHGSTHYITIGAACAVYLLIAGSALTYTAYVAEMGKN